MNLESAQINQDITRVNVEMTPLAMERFANQNVAACTKVTSTIATKKIQAGFEIQPSHNRILIGQEK